MKGPVARSLNWYRAHGFRAYSVSRWVPQARRTVDFAGFADIIAFCHERKITIACQSTTTGNQSARVKKILAFDTPKEWIDAGNQIQVHGWALKGPRGTRKLWQLTITPITIPMITESEKELEPAEIF